MAQKQLSVNGWVRRFRRAGYTVELSNAGHWKVVDGGRFVLSFGATPSNSRWQYKLRREIKRQGLDLSRKPNADTRWHITIGAARKDKAMAEHTGGVLLADTGRTVAVRRRLREVVDEINSHLPGHRGAMAHVVRELMTYAAGHGMQAWPNEGAGAQMIRSMYRTDHTGGFALWAVALVEAGLDSVPMPGHDEGRSPELDDAIARIVTAPEPAAGDEPEPRTVDFEHGWKPAMTNEEYNASLPRDVPNGEPDALEVLYRLAAGGMDVRAAYTVARAYRAGLRP